MLIVQHRDCLYKQPQHDTKIRWQDGCPVQSISTLSCGQSDNLQHQSALAHESETHFFFFFKVSGTLFYFIYLFIYFWLCWVFVSVRGFSLVVASGGHSSSRCAGLSLSRPLLLRSTGSRCAGSVVVAHRLSCSAACGILPDQGLNPCPLHWQADSQPLRHQGSPQRPILSLNSTVTAQWPSAKMDETFPT